MTAAKRSLSASRLAAVLVHRDDGRDFVHTVCRTLPDAIAVADRLRCGGADAYAEPARATDIAGMVRRD